MFIYNITTVAPNHISELPIAKAIGFSLKCSNKHSINELSPQSLRFYLKSYCKSNNPWFKMFIAAFSSRLRVCPQLQVHTLSESFKSELMQPQNLHILELGNHLSILISFFPWISNFCWSLVRNIPNPLSLVDFPKFNDCAMFCKFKSSIQTIS